MMNNLFHIQIQLFLPNMARLLTCHWRRIRYLIPLGASSLDNPLLPKTLTPSLSDRRSSSMDQRQDGDLQGGEL